MLSEPADCHISSSAANDPFIGSLPRGTSRTPLRVSITRTGVSSVIPYRDRTASGRVILPPLSIVIFCGDFIARL